MILNVIRSLTIANKCSFQVALHMKEKSTNERHVEIGVRDAGKILFYYVNSRVDATKYISVKSKQLLIFSTVLSGDINSVAQCFDRNEVASKRRELKVVWCEMRVNGWSSRRLCVNFRSFS